MQDDTPTNGFVVGNSTEIDPIYAQGRPLSQLEILKRKLRGVSLVFPSNVKTAMSPEEDLLALYKKYRYWNSRYKKTQTQPAIIADYLGLGAPAQHDDPAENLRLALISATHGPTLAPVLDTPIKTSMDLASSTQLVNSLITPQDNGVLGFMAPPPNTGGTMGGLQRLLLAVSSAGSPGNYKQADHPQDRLAERTSLPANYTHRLRKVLAKTTLPKGDAYARMPDNSFAVFKDAGGKKRLASFLSKHMTPKGKDVTGVVRENLKTSEVYYHGSSKKLDRLRSGSWVTPHKEDALSFGVPWSSKDLVNSGGSDGRPPQTLEFKPGKEPKDGPVYVYQTDTAAVKDAKTNTGKSYDWNRQVTEDTPVKLVESHSSWKNKLLGAGAGKTASIPEDAVVYSAVPDVDSVMSHGLLSSHALNARPDLLEIARPDPEKREAWKKRLASQMSRVHRRGPNVFFTLPDPDKIGPQHYINKDNLKTVEVALGRLIKDQPDTRVYGLELVPHGTEGKRKGYLSHKKLRELLGSDPKELWQHYDDPVGRYYAANVPHGAVVTSDGVIDPKYIKAASDQTLEHLRSLLAKFKKDADKSGYNYFVVAHGDDPAVGAETSRVHGQPDSVVREHKKLHSDFSKSIGAEHVNWESKTAESDGKSKSRPMSDGKSKSRPMSDKALAKALGLKVEELPKNLHTSVADGPPQEGTADLLKALRKMSKTAGFANEALAQKAHQAVLDEYGLTEADGSKYWKLKTSIYKKMGGTFTGHRDPPTKRI